MHGPLVILLLCIVATIVAAPDNDVCTNAIDIDLLCDAKPRVLDVSTFSASNYPRPATCNSYYTPSGPAVWYKFTVTQPSNVAITVLGCNASAAHELGLGFAIFTEDCDHLVCFKTSGRYCYKNMTGMEAGAYYLYIGTFLEEGMDFKLMAVCYPPPQGV